MSERQNSDNAETLFSFELLVEYIRTDERKGCNISDELAVGVRLLDFPTLLIYQPVGQSGTRSQGTEQRGEDDRREHAFNRGKSCFFKMNLGSLHTQLANTPLYAMVLDVKEEIPKLLGTSLIPLAKVMDRIKRDSEGALAPSSHGERLRVGVCNLTGENIGSISLSYKLLSLGASLLPHITERRGVVESTGGQRSQKSPQKTSHNHTGVRSPASDKSVVHGSTQNDKMPSEITLTNDEAKQDSGGGVGTQSEHKPRRTQKPAEETEISPEEDLTIFCPPHLFYCNPEEGKGERERGDCPFLNLDAEAFTFYETSSSEKEDKIEVTGCSKRIDRSPDVRTTRNQETSESAAPGVLGEALQQLPLLNALLVELSQLNTQSPSRSMSIHPNLAWIYRPVSAESPAKAPKAQTKSPHKKPRPITSPYSKSVLSPRPYSAPGVRRVKDGVDVTLTEFKSTCKSRKKLVYGTTKTFDLRMKHISPLKTTGRECAALIQNEKQSSAAKDKKTQARKKKVVKSSQRRLLNRSSSLDENIETMMQRIPLRGTVTLKHGYVRREKQEGHDSLRSSQKPSLSEQNLECVHIPSVEQEDSDVAPNQPEKQEHGRSESNPSLAESDRCGGGEQESSESRIIADGSPKKSSLSDSEAEAEAEVDYDDDFNSLESSDAYSQSPEPFSSPGPSRAKSPKSPKKTPKSPYRSNSGSGSDSGSGPDGLLRGSVLPAPVKAPDSPTQRPHLIRPRTQASALSLSSSSSPFSDDDDDDDDGDQDGWGPRRTNAFSVKDKTEGSSVVVRSPRAGSVVSSRGQRSESSRKSSPLQGFSAESISPFDPREAEELEDELGSLDFRNKYQHISELVANKLPGYTM